jgi:hypothetical protein
MIYSKVKTAIEALLTPVAQIKSIDWFNDQYNNTEKEDAEPYPAVYIELQNPLTWMQAGNNMQTADATITLHVVVNSLKSEPDALFTIAALVESAIQGKWLADGQDQLSTEIIRTVTEPKVRARNLKVYKTSFKTHLFDNTFMDVYQTIPPNTVSGTTEINP